MQRAIALLKQVCPSCQLVAPITDVGEMKTSPAVVIATTASFISERLGVTVPVADIATLLKPLGFVVKKGKGDSLTISVPSWRVGSDVSIPEDIVEEVGRRLGYDSIAPRLPLRPLSTPNTKYVTRLSRQLKVALAGRFEFTEANTYSFSLPSPLATPGGLRLENPPASHLVELRQSLIPNLIAVVAQNIRQQRELALFELGRVFRSGAGSYDVAPGSTKALPPQPRSLSLALTSPQDDAVTLYRQLKGVVGQLLEQTGYQPEWIKLEAAPAYAPWIDLASTIGVTVQGEIIGFVTVAPAEALASAKIRQPVAVAELDITRLVKIPPTGFQYQSIQKFPSIVEDISLVVDQRVAWSDLKKFCVGYNPLITTVELFDVFEGSKVGASKRSLAFHITFSSQDRTLTAEEVQTIIKSLAADLTKKFKAEIR
jgi:phenylalanyl-tRNA synthetase beta chain